MKKKTLFIVSFLLLSTSTFAQLSVESSGKVKIQTNTIRSLEVSGKTEGIYVSRTGESTSSDAAAIRGICDKDGVPTSIGVEGKSVSSTQTHYPFNMLKNNCTINYCPNSDFSLPLGAELEIIHGVIN